MRTIAALLGALALVTVAPAALACATLVTVTDAASGREIAAQALGEGERAVLSWTNSLFRVRVVEVFVVHDGVLRLDEVTFEDPAGREPPQVSAADVEDLYHTGGPFRATGLSRPIARVTFRVGEIGDPTLRLGMRQIRFLDEVGFGGGVVLETR